MSGLVGSISLVGKELSDIVMFVKQEGNEHQGSSRLSSLDFPGVVAESENPEILKDKNVTVGFGVALKKPILIKTTDGNTASIFVVIDAERGMEDLKVSHGNVGAFVGQVETSISQGDACFFERDTKQNIVRVFFRPETPYGALRAIGEARFGQGSKVYSPTEDNQFSNFKLMGTDAKVVVISDTEYDELYAKIREQYNLTLPPPVYKKAPPSQPQCCTLF